MKKWQEVSASDIQPGDIVHVIGRAHVQEVTGVRLSGKTMHLQLENDTATINVDQPISVFR